MKAKKFTLFFMTGAFCLFSTSLSAKDIYANAADGNDANDGLTPESSVETVAQAYALASDGDIIKLTGTFYFEAEISLEKSITIEGLNETNAILDGQGACRFFTLKNNATFKNITFQNGYATEGGAFYMPIGFWRAMNFTDCVFDGNSAGGQGGVFRMITYGGTDLLKINRCLFINNFSGDHGGVFSYIPEGGDPVGNKATLSISNSTFTLNKNNGGVGGIMFVGGGATAWATFNFSNITVSGNSDFENTSGNQTGFVFMSGATTVNINNSIIEGNPLQNGDFSDLCFDATPTALTIKNSIVGHVTVWGVTVDPVNFTATESTVNSSKIKMDALVAGLGTFNGTYFPLTSESLAYDYGKMSNLPTELNSDQLGEARTNTSYTSAGAVEFYHDVPSEVKNPVVKPEILSARNQITINTKHSEVEIYAVTGILVHKSTINESETIHLESGIYFVKSVSGLNKSITKVIVK